jgi:Pyridoxamine 5'-phosphate oxidase
MMTTPPFDVDAFLAEPNQAFVATNGPTVRPLWYQWEDGCFWLISGPWAKLYSRTCKDPEIALIVDICDVKKGRILQVMASGAVETVPYDIPRARRMLHRYLGPDEASWSSKPDDYRGYLRDSGPHGAVWLKLKPRKLLPFNFCYQE